MTITWNGIAPSGTSIENVAYSYIVPNPDPSQEISGQGLARLLPADQWAIDNSGYSATNENYLSWNPKDAGFRAVLPGPAGQVETYMVRVMAKVALVQMPAGSQIADVAQKASANPTFTVTAMDTNPAGGFSDTQSSNTNLDPTSATFEFTTDTTYPTGTELADGNIAVVYSTSYTPVQIAREVAAAIDLNYGSATYGALDVTVNTTSATDESDTGTIAATNETAYTLANLPVPGTSGAPMVTGTYDDSSGTYPFTVDANGNVTWGTNGSPGNLDPSTPAFLTPSTGQLVLTWKPGTAPANSSLQNVAYQYLALTDSTSATPTAQIGLSGNLVNLSFNTFQPAAPLVRVNPTGNYTLQVGLTETEFFPGSSIASAVINYATNGIQVNGEPMDSPLAGSSARLTPAEERPPTRSGPGPTRRRAPPSTWEI